MKIKCIPQDFQVYEIASPQTGKGTFALYKLSKTGIGTPEVVNAILQRWNISRYKIGYGGLKDRHAVTEQYLTIKEGPRRDLEQDSFNLNYLGQMTRPFNSEMFDGNRFVITIRDLNPEEETNIRNQADVVINSGVPNYFDNQRFGSLGISGEFIGAALCESRFERALYLSLAEENYHDRSDEKKQKKILREHWGDWLVCKEKLQKSNRRSVVTYLCDHPQNFKQAFALINRDLRSIFLSAFQSSLWNRLLSSMILQACDLRGVKTFTIGRDELHTPKIPLATEYLAKAESLPLPSARLKFAQDDELGNFYKEKLASWSWPLEKLRLKYPRDIFFSKGARQGFIRPQHFQLSFDQDEIYKGKRKCLLQFELLRGCYATMVIKSIVNHVEDIPE